MGRIVFLNCFSKHEVSGGVKTTYRHAALLREQGFDVAILQPDGTPPWLEEDVKCLVHDEIFLEPHDIAVFPETLNGWFAEVISDEWQCAKVIFCQNPYYFYSYCSSRSSLDEWGIQHMIVPSEWAKESIQSILGMETVDIVPPIVDTTIFAPRKKKLQVVVAGWKWGRDRSLPSYDSLICQILRIKYPELAEIPWIGLKDLSELEVAQIMGESVVCVSLGRFESLGITALEAMASGCVVVGFHGGGGAEYATSHNGFWHSPEDIEGVADSVALALHGAMTSNFMIQRQLEGGRRAAAQYSQAKAVTALCDVYGKMLRKQKK